MGKAEWFFLVLIIFKVPNIIKLLQTSLNNSKEGQHLASLFLFIFEDSESNGMNLVRWSGLNEHKISSWRYRPYCRRSVDLDESLNWAHFKKFQKSFCWWKEMCNTLSHHKGEFLRWVLLTKSEPMSGKYR